MATGLDTTLEVLSKSRNEAVSAVLLTALEGSQDAVQDTVLKALVARRKKSGHLEVIKRWHTLSTVQREIVLEGRGRMSGALRDAVLSKDEQLFANACQVIEECNEFDLISTLVTLAENQKSKHALAATTLVQRLVKRLSEIVHGPRDYSDRRDPEAIRRFVLESLERSVERFRQHQRQEIIEAFVVLGGNSSSLLRAILDDPRHACYLTVINTLTSSSSAGVIKLLLSTLQSDFTPTSILNVISRRTDKEFVTQLLSLSDAPISGKMLKNLGRIRSFAWLQSGDEDFNSFDEENQARAIKLVAVSGVKQDDFLDIVETVLKSSGPLGRLAACEALVSIQGSHANQLVLDSIYDEDPHVQAVCVGQLRDRHLAGTMAILLKMTDSPHSIVQEAARESLSEFTFANFLVGYESMNDDARRTTAALVKKVDPEATAGLITEMEAQSRKRRMRAVEMTELLGLVTDVSEKLLELLEDEDHLVRAIAAQALQFCPTPEAEAALKIAVNDRSSAVQNAASNSLEALGQASTTDNLSPVEDNA